MSEVIKLGTSGNFGVKEGGTLAYNDTNGVFKAIELASSRASGATYVNQSGLIKDAEVGVPRIDWTNGVGELLLEPLSRNLITYSEDFSNVSWTKTNATVTANSSLSPDGSVNADQIIATSTSNVLVQDGGISVVANKYSASVFLKYNSHDLVRVRLANYFIANTSVTFNLQNGTIDNVGVEAENAKIEDYGNGWYRCSFTSLSNAAAGSNAQFIVEFLGTYSSGSSVYIFGAQLEQLSYPTSYIRTSGTTVTRIADAVTGNSSLGQVINSSEGVLYAEMSALANDGTQNLLGLNGGSISNSILFGFSTSNGIRFYGAESGTATGFDLTTAATITSNLKLALKWSLNDVKFYINGTQVGTDTSFAASSSLNELSFDNGSGANDFYGRIRELKVYDTALTDSQLQSLTTL